MTAWCSNAEEISHNIHYAIMSGSSRAAPQLAARAAVTPLKAWTGLVAMSVGMFMAILDVQIVASSLPDIQAGLHFRLDQLSWVQTAYLMAEVVAIPLTGWLTRVMSTRGAFVVSVLGFTAASLACAGAGGFWSMVPARLIQGFCGGLLIPLVFSAIFVMFDGPARFRATLVAGIMAMLAPTLGPTVGGFITDTYSWRWLFLINIVPGIAVAAVVFWAIDIDRADRRAFASIDLASLPLLALFLGSLQVVLKEAPQRGWGAPEMLLLALVCLSAGVWAFLRCLRHPRPLIDLAPFRDRNFAAACWFSFVFGIGLYGATFLLPVHLGAVRQYEALEIGEIMLVTGVAQLAAAPLATFLEPRVDSRYLIGAGFALFAIGLIGNGFMTATTDFWGLFWQQIARGGAIMLCLLSTTSLALGGLEPLAVANASGLFNLMRNLGGAIGLALIDTVIEERAPKHADAIARRLLDGDPAAARFIGMRPELFQGSAGAPIDPMTQGLMGTLLRHAGLTAAFNDAWLLVGLLVLLSIPLLLLLRRPRPLPPP